MKNITIIASLLMLIINSCAGVIFRNYPIANMIAVDISIVLSAILVLLINTVPLKMGFKIGLNSFFILTGIIRIGILSFAPEPIPTQWSYLICLIILLVEILSLLASNNISKKMANNHIQ